MGRDRAPKDVAAISGSELGKNWGTGLHLAPSFGSARLERGLRRSHDQALSSPFDGALPCLPRLPRHPAGQVCVDPSIGRSAYLMSGSRSDRKNPASTKTTATRPVALAASAKASDIATTTASDPGLSAIRGNA